GDGRPTALARRGTRAGGGPTGRCRRSVRGCGPWRGVSWLPPDKCGAICLSVDDVHPAPGAAEALGHIRWLQARHPRLRVTFFTTPDWRTIEPYPTRRVL